MSDETEHKEACCSVVTGFDSDCCCTSRDYEDHDMEPSK